VDLSDLAALARPESLDERLVALGVEDEADVLRPLLAAVRAKDPMTYEHVLRTTVASVELTEHLGGTVAECRTVALVALLHDVGKVDVPDEVLLSPQRLDDEQWDLMRAHVVHSVGILRDHGVDETVVAAVGAHHEHWDGGGYPSGTVGASIPRAARLVAVCDAVDAMRFARRYRSINMTVAEVVEVLEVGAGTQWDPDLAAAMVDRLHGA
jgi:putative nucleotidyltransferase with HDIG domain